MSARPTPLDTAWLALLDHAEALLDLAALVRRAGFPRVRPGQEAARRRAAAALAAFGLDRWERDGVRLTLTSAPTIRVGDELVVTGASRLVVRMAPRRTPLAPVASLDEARRRREGRAA